jgi:hypothetical protein
MLVFSTLIRAFIDYTAEPPQLNLLDAASGDINFTVDYFAYLSNFASGITENTLSRDYPDLLITKSKILIFSDFNDPIVADLEDLFQRRFAEARRQDSFRMIAGNENRM